jgi:hypothetical protein
MTKLAREETAVGFVDQASRGPDAAQLPEERWTALRADADSLGLIGTLVGIADADPVVDPAVRTELVLPLDRDLRDALGEPAEADQEPLAVAASLEARIARFLAAKGSRGPDLLCRLVARVTFDTWGLATNRLSLEDVLAAYDVVAWSSGGQDARESAKRVLRLSRHSARAVLGHLAEQLALVHSLGQDEEITWAEVDRRLHEFAPRIFAQRLPSIVRYLLPDEARLRLAFVTWGRLRGLVFPRAAVLSIREQITPEKPMKAIGQLELRKDRLAALRAADAAWPLARTLEKVFLSRVLAAPT